MEDNSEILGNQVRNTLLTFNELSADFESFSSDGQSTARHDICQNFYATSALKSQILRKKTRKSRQ